MAQFARAPARPTIGVVVPVLNGAETILACLEAVQEAAGRWAAPVSVILVDNGSRDATVSLVRARYPELVRVLEHRAGTVGALRNLGANNQQTLLLSFVDADCVVCADYFSIAWQAMQSSGADAVGCSYALPTKPGWIERAWHAMHEPSRAGPVEWLYAGNFVIRSEAFTRVGGFDESLPSGEDPELGGRLRAAGFRLYCDPSLVSVHLGNPRTLTGFFRQQWWHGLGTFERGISLRRNRPLFMATLHGLLSLLAAAAMLTGVFRSAPAILAGLAASQFLVPLVTVAFRQRQTRRWSNPLPGAVLYWLYYWARLVAIASITLGFPEAPRGRRPPPPGPRPDRSDTATGTSR